MNKVQKLILICGLLSLAATISFPPWSKTAYKIGTRDIYGFRSEKNGGYHFIFSPPAPEQDSPIFGTKIDISRLGLEWLGVVAATGIALLTSQFIGNKKQGAAQNVK